RRGFPEATVPAVALRGSGRDRASHHAGRKGGDGVATAEPIRRVSREHPCPVCGKTKWCGFTPHFVICMRVPSDRQARNGGWIHPLDAARAIDLPPLPPQPAHEPASVERRDRVYRALLG